MSVIQDADVTVILKGGFYAAGQTANLDKPQVKAVYQFFEDWYEGEKAVVSNGLNALTTPWGIILANADKKRIAKAFLFTKFKRGG